MPHAGAQRRRRLYIAAMVNAIVAIVALALAVVRDEWQYYLPAAVFVGLAVVWFRRVSAADALPL
jgi:hypothetical protein